MRLIRTKIPYSIIITALLCVFFTHFAHAQLSSATSIASSSLLGLSGFLKIIAYLAYLGLTVSGWFLALCGTLLNVSLQLTTHIGAFIQSTPAIYTVWNTIRDFVSMILIFFIIWAAIQMMLNLKTPNYNSLIKSVIIAGVLINFSFFLTQIAIDASNIVSLQFFNAIAPNQTATYTASDSLSTIISKSIKDGSGGLSGIFLSSLQVNQYWANNGNFDTTISGKSDSAQLIGIIIANYTGSLVQILAGLSFLAAAVAALWRTIILVFLLGFSSIWVASYAIPQLSDFKNKWMEHFKSNLIFLPVYLAFLYVSVFVISKSGLNELVSSISTTQGNAGSVYLSLFITGAIILFFINIPLFVAISVAGTVAKSVGVIKSINDLSLSLTKRGVGMGVAGAISGGTLSLASKSAGSLARATIGSSASMLDKKLAGTKAGNSLMGRDIRSATLGALAKRSFGTARSYEQQQKDMVAVKAGAKAIERRGRLEALISSGSTNPADYASVIKEMKGDEKSGLDPEILKNPQIIKSLRKDDFDAIKKSTDISDEDKKNIKDGRMAALRDAVNKGENAVVKNMLKNMDTDDIMDLGPTLREKNLISQLTPGQLKNLSEAGLDKSIKIAIKAEIDANPTFPSYGYMQNPSNAYEWT